MNSQKHETPVCCVDKFSSFAYKHKNLFLDPSESFAPSLYFMQISSKTNCATAKSVQSAHSEMLDGKHHRVRSPECQQRELERWASLMFKTADANKVGNKAESSLHTVRHYLSFFAPFALSLTIIH